MTTPGTDPRRAAREALWASLGVIAFLGAVKHLADVVPFVAEHQFSLALAFQLFLPLYLLDRNGVSERSLGVSIQLWRQRYGQDLKWFAIVGGLTAIVFPAAHHVWMTEWEGRQFDLRWPADVLSNALINFGLVAICEELFFRGYLQERLAHIWGGSRPRLARWAPIVAASAVFALAHYIGEYNGLRLAVFFPGLVFGWLRARTGTILSAVAYHGFCNVLADILRVSYHR